VGTPMGCSGEGSGRGGRYPLRRKIGQKGLTPSAREYRAMGSVAIFAAGDVR